MDTETKNIVLIGMPGSGKTTLGNLLASRLNRKCIDLDDYIELENGCSIPDIFKNGEEYFRKLESKAVEKVSVEKNIIIATGGGVIKKKCNIQNLKKNGIVVFIDRPLENIISDVDISGRPLLKKGIKEIEKIYNERYDIYKAYCDFSVHNILNLETIVDDIVKSCNEYI
ncbi:MULTISPECIES: shikimate kinase [Clostridium]|uniref:Shikimate kinase n=1 Tax=Clostridium ragsdalei P11 TaxID=1353534 RepID=A0A1A6AK08_9CLOT|nr:MULTISPECIES: shikimate kinase [Clostridium]OBR90333.1 shikimate kinase [Clostridium ragsdalei P11]QXE18136.1 shikimate kinase [Clostridium sp. 001]